MSDPLAFLAAPAPEVAPQLLGAVLHGRGASIRLTEVEAYLGEHDPGSHAFRGPTPRTRIMYGPAGSLYVYFSYGRHVCANIVCGPEGEAMAVLLRAGEVISGLDAARDRRATSRSDADLARGPARLCVALGITLADNGARLGREFRLEPPQHPIRFETGPRTGVSGDGGTDRYPWRFWVPHDPSVSPYRVSVATNRSR